MRRDEPFCNHVYYHVFNKTIQNTRLFSDSKFCSYFYSLLLYYRTAIKDKPCYSDYRKLRDLNQSVLNEKIYDRRYFRVTIAAYCFMPNHFHLLIRQAKTQGISRYISDCINGLTRYYNCYYQRKGPIFLPSFHSKTIYSEKELLHVSRYIHLNPSTSNIVSSEELAEYRWSSYQKFIQPDQYNPLTTPFLYSSPHAYKEFVENNAAYQETLHSIRYKRTIKKHLFRLSQ